MLLSRLNFCQFFSRRPGRRRITAPVPAQLELLHPRILLSASSTDTNVSEEPAAEEPASDEVAPETTEPEMNTSEESSTDDVAPETSEPEMNESDPAGDETSDPGADVIVAAPWLDYVEVIVVSGTTTINGAIGDYDVSLGLSLVLDGVFAGGSASIQSDGSFSVLYGTELSGFGTVSLRDADNVELDFWELYA